MFLVKYTNSFFEHDEETFCLNEIFGGILILCVRVVELRYELLMIRSYVLCLLLPSLSY